MFCGVLRSSVVWLQRMFYAALWQMFSRHSEYQSFCLAHLFTHVSFENGVLGLAYIAGPRVYSVGGICSPSKSIIPTLQIGGFWAQFNFSCCFRLFGCQYQCNWLPGKTRLQNDLLCVEWDVKPYTLTHSYSSMLFATDLESLADHGENLSWNFFLGITKPSSCLHHLLPPRKLNSVTSRLRSYEKYPRLCTRTKRYCSFINCALNQCQTKITM